MEHVVNDWFAAYHGDSCEILGDLPDTSVHFSIYSPPFYGNSGAMYQYSSSERDLSNCVSYEQFKQHYRFIVESLHRVTLPGRFTAVHCTDVPTGNSGGDWLMDFPGDIVRLHESCGWHLKARHIIWKEPLWVRNRTMTKDLAHKTIVDDSANGGVASADQLLIFQRTGTNKIPIAHPTGFDCYAGECPMPADILRFKNFQGDQKQNKFSHWIWRRYASSVWDDIRMGRVLPYRESKEEDDEKHVHPLQLDVIDRAIALRTNPGETVLTPFMGVGSEVYAAVASGRRGIGIELKGSYFKQAVRNLEIALYELEHPNEVQATLEFDSEEIYDEELAAA